MNSSTKKHLLSYTILKVKTSSTPAQIRENYLRLIKQYHPDNRDTGDHGRFLRLKVAYDSIKDAPLSSTNSSLNFRRKLESNFTLGDHDFSVEDTSHKAHALYRQRTKNFDTVGLPRKMDIISSFKIKLREIFKL